MSIKPLGKFQLVLFSSAADPSALSMHFPRRLPLHLVEPVVHEGVSVLKIICLAMRVRPFGLGAADQALWGSQGFIAEARLFFKCVVLTGDSRRPAREILAELSPRRPPDQLVRMFVHAAAHERAYRAMLGHGENSSARRVIGEAFAGFLLPRIRSVAGEAAEPAVPAEIISQFAAGALMNLLEWWLEANRPYPPEAMAVYSMCLCMDGCYGVLGVPHRE
jgi:hypothetical protein